MINFIEIMVELFNDNKKVIRFLVTLLGTCIILVISVFSILSWIGKNENLQISYDSKGIFTITANSGGPKTTFFNIPASSFWYDTELDIKSNAEVTISAQGSIHLSLDDLISSVDKGERPNMSWTEPKGAAISKNNAIHEHRKQMAMDTALDYGRLLAGLNPKEDNAPGVTNPRPKDLKIENIGTCYTFKNNTGRTQRLYLIVNDNFIDSKDTVEFKKYYIGDEVVWEELGSIATKSKMDTLSKKFKTIVKEEYWNIFYDDNIGNFFVQVSINEDP